MATKYQALIDEPQETKILPKHEYADPEKPIVKLNIEEENSDQLKVKNIPPRLAKAMIA